MIILIILIILVLLSFNLFRNLFKNDTTVLDDVKLKEEDANNNGFALMIETENADGTTSYVESSSNTWPTDMKFNSEKSGCVDVNNNIIEDALEYDSTNNIMNVSVSGTAYCYVYFDIDKSLVSYIKDNPGAGFNTTMEGGLYRYQGTNDVVTNNYICFGTTDKTTCTGSPSTYMYRIIGIAENGQMKIIKKTSLGSKAWHNNYTANTSWEDSDLFKGLNGIEGGYYTNLFVNNSTYTYMEEDSNWYNKIATTTWKYGYTTTADKTASALYSVENGWTTSVSAKIGLIYLHDYYYAYQSGGINCYSSSNSRTCKSAWMHISKNDSGTSSSYEWTMSRLSYSTNDGFFGAWYVYSDGDVGGGRAGNLDAVRPVFYLTPDVEYTSGTGTIFDPFLIKE